MFYQRIKQCIAGNQLRAYPESLHPPKYNHGQMRVPHLDISTNSGVIKSIGETRGITGGVEDGPEETVARVGTDEIEKESFGIGPFVVGK